MSSCRPQESGIHGERNQIHPNLHSEFRCNDAVDRHVFDFSCTLSTITHSSISHNMPGTDAFWALGGQALLPIVLGSFKSLRTPTKLKKKRRAAKRRSGKLVVDDSEDEDEEEELDEVLTMADSILFPILGSAALLGLWFVIKYVDKKWIDLVFGLYCECGSRHID